jgi:hypothetical protein
MIGNYSPEDIARMATSVEYGLWKPFEAICAVHLKFGNSANYKTRIECLKEMKARVLELKESIKKALGLGFVPFRLAISVNEKVKPTLTSHYLNLTQLYQCCIHAQTPDAKLSWLTAMFYLLEDMAEVCEKASAEPEPLLDVHGD